MPPNTQPIRRFHHGIFWLLHTQAIPTIRHPAIRRFPYGIFWLLRTQAIPTMRHLAIRRFHHGIFWLLLPLLIASGCGSPSDPEQQIRARIQEAKQLAEERKGVALGQLISDHYWDERGRSARDLRRIAIGYLMRHEQIHLLARVRNVTLPQEDTGQAVVIVAMLGQREAEYLPLPMIRADLYRFDLTFQLEKGDWQLVRGQWRPAKPEDLVGG